MVVNPVFDIDARTRSTDGPDVSNKDNSRADIDPSQFWLAAAGDTGRNSTHSDSKKLVHSDDKHSSKIPSLPDLDLHQVPGPTWNVAEDLIDDLNTIIHNHTNVSVRNQQPAKLFNGNAPGDLPVINCEGIEPGHVGVLMSKNADGHTYYTPFIAAAPESVSSGFQPPLSINEAAARELHIDGDLKKGLKPKLDVIAVPWDEGVVSGRVLPRTKDELHTAVLERLHDMAEKIRDKQAEEFEKLEATLPEPPAPDPEFGYRRTARSAEELRTVQENFRKLARESMDAAEPNGIEARMKAFGQQAQKDIKKYQDEVNKHSLEIDRADRLEKRLNRLSEKETDKESPRAKAIAEQLKTAEDNAKKIDAKLQTAQYNLSYAQHELKLSKDKLSFTLHMQARASAAAMMSMNPDMEGSLTGHRVVINSGHYKEDPKFPGFEFDGTAEWKLNLESQEVTSEMVKMAGGAVKVINQSDLRDKTMSGLANAIKAAKPEAAISIHHDSNDPPDSPAMKGTLTLQCAKTTGAWSLELAKAVHMAKLNYIGLDDRVNKNGDSVGIREQCGRGVQGRNVDAPFILDEQASTHKDMWPLARDPKVNAQIQFSHVVSLYEFLEKKPRYKISPETGKLWKEQIWSKIDMDDVFKRHPKVGDWK